MIQKRIEIKKVDGLWAEVELYSGKGLKYNSVINKIASTTDRGLSHSNTFKIPWTKKNSETLGLNVFNSSTLANSLNEKYEAKYYVNNTLLQQGFVVINNMDNGIPSLNFIDEALSLTDKWGSTTYREFLQDDILLENIDADYLTAINFMKIYDLDKTAVATVLPNITGETFPIAYFPNTVNCIGEKFQVDSNGDRPMDYFNPYQSRPIFNAYAFLKMVTDAYGYTLIENPSVDWSKVKITAISDDKLAKGELDSGSTIVEYAPVLESLPHYTESVPVDFVTVMTSHASMRFSTLNGITPVSIPNLDFPATNGVIPGIFVNPNVNDINAWWYSRTIFVPDTSGGNVGTINFKADSYSPNNSQWGYAIFEDTTDSTNHIFQALVFTENNSTTAVMDVTIDKNQFEPPPTNGGSLIGLYVVRSSVNINSPQSMENMVVTESVLSGGVVTYDEFGQFEQDNPDLTHTAPTKTIKQIINGILQRFGALIEINSKENTVEIFTYESYGTKRTNGEFEDWSNYHLEYMSPNFNTNYGNNYAAINSIGLGNPYVGNSTKWYLGNQVANSKLKEFTTDYNTQFSDITNMVQTNYAINPYDEFSIEGASMLEFNVALGQMTQRRFDNSTQTGTYITGVPNLINVNYSQMPVGQSKWYTLIDESLRCKPTFLLPMKDVEFLDIKKPIYVNSLGGFYIIEEIEQYEDDTTPVKVKLIKLPSSWE
tara:strand:+ start:1028 stop:3166 length:2139 start_codon:yes stop_codon:yes gene_type:complete